MKEILLKIVTKIYHIENNWIYWLWYRNNILARCCEQAFKSPSICIRLRVIWSYHPDLAVNAAPEISRFFCDLVSVWNLVKCSLIPKLPGRQCLVIFCLDLKVWGLFNTEDFPSSFSIKIVLHNDNIRVLENNTQNPNITKRELLVTEIRRSAKTVPDCSHLWKNADGCS